MTVRCRSCRAEIVWAQTVQGKAIPLDAEPERRFVLEVQAPGKSPRARLVETYQTHFATCPDSDEWRKNHGEAH